MLPLKRIELKLTRGPQFEDVQLQNHQRKPRTYKILKGTELSVPK